MSCHLLLALSQLSVAPLTLSQLSVAPLAQLQLSVIPLVLLWPSVISLVLSPFWPYCDSPQLQFVPTFIWNAA